MNDEKLFLEATKEVASSVRNHRLWVKALSVSAGDRDKAKNVYVKMRVEQLKSHQQASQELIDEGADSEALSVTSDPETRKEHDSLISSQRKQIENDEAAQSKELSEPIIFLAKLGSGYFGLAKTYWVYGFLAGVIVNVLFNFIASTTGFIVFAMIYSVYQTLVLMGIWNASDKYKGPRAWAVLAKVVVVLGAIQLAVLLLVAFSLLDFA